MPRNTEISGNYWEKLETVVVKIDPYLNVTFLASCWPWCSAQEGGLCRPLLVRGPKAGTYNSTTKLCPDQSQAFKKINNSQACFHTHIYFFLLIIFFCRTNRCKTFRAKKRKIWLRTTYQYHENFGSYTEAKKLRENVCFLRLYRTKIIIMPKLLLRHGPWKFYSRVLRFYEPLPSLWRTSFFFFRRMFGCLNIPKNSTSTKNKTRK